MKRPVFQSRRALRDLRQLVINYRQLAEIAGNPEIKQRMLDMAATLPSQGRRG